MPRPISSSPLGSAFAVLTPTTTRGRAIDRDVVVPSAPTPPLAQRLTSDERATAEIRRVDAIDVLGLGPLTATEIDLERRAARLVRAQGVGAVRLRIRLARDQARAQYDGSATLGSADGLRRADTVLRRLDVLDAAVDRLDAERARVRAAVTPRAVGYAQDFLAATKRRVEGWVERYRNPAALRSLRDDAQRLLDARRGEPARYDALHAEIARRHPVLASMTRDAPFLELWAFAQETDTIDVHGMPTEVPRPLNATIEAHLERALGAIGAMQARLRDEPEAVWRLPELIDATLVAEGVPSGGMVAAHARDVVRDTARDEALVRAFVSIAAVGLGVAAALPSGGASLAVAAVVTSSLDAYQLYLSFSEYDEAADAFDAGLSSRRSNPLPVLLDGAMAMVGAAGAVGALAKTRFAETLARQDTVGDVARRLDLSVGRARAEVIFAASEDFTSLAAVDPEVWIRLADVDEAGLRGALDALGADFARWAASLGPEAIAEVAARGEALRGAARALGPEAFDAWAAALDLDRLAEIAARVDAELWGHLLATPIAPRDLDRVLGLGDDVVRALAPSLKGEGLAALARVADGGGVRVLDDGFVEVRGLRFHPREAARADGRVSAILARWEALVARVPELMRFGPVSARDVDALESAVAASARGERFRSTKALDRLSERADVTLADVVGSVRPTIRLGARAERIATAAPELREGLERLAASSVSVKTRERVLEGLERAVRVEDVEVSRPHLARWLSGAADAGHSIEAYAIDRVMELEYALEVIDGGRAAEGSTVYLGVEAGEKVALRAGGPWVEVPRVMGGLEDVDVLFLDRSDVVQVVEVKRSDQALWEVLEKTSGRYPDKFEKICERGAEVGQARAARVAIRSPGEAWLGRPVPRDDGRTPREALGAKGLSIEVAQ